MQKKKKKKKKKKKERELGITIMYINFGKTMK
jgi:hypothetical protein